MSHQRHHVGLESICAILNNMGDFAQGSLCFSHLLLQLSHRYGKGMHQSCFEMGDDLCPKIKVCFDLFLFSFFCKRLIYKHTVFLKLYFVLIAATKQEKFTRPLRNRKKVFFLSRRDV